MSSAGTGRTWLAARAPLWRSLADAATAARRRGRTTVAGAQQLLDGYRSLARDLASARRELPGSVVTRALEDVYGSFHALVNRPPRNTWASLLRMQRVEVPAVVRSLRGPLLFVFCVFVLSAGAGWWLISSYPDLVGLVASEQMIDTVEHGKLWTEGLFNIAPSSLESIRIFSNNIVVSITAFCLGVFYGLGTFYIVALNGLLLGGVFAFTRQHGLAGALFGFVIAHGVVEISWILVAGAAGMALGESIARPDGPSRLASFQRRTAEVSKLLPLMAAMLVGCGLIEAYVSPDPGFPLANRIFIGICYWFVMVAALTGRLFGAGRAP